MPTPVEVFAEVAARHGDVDASDLRAVQRFYDETLQTLDPAAILIILEELLACEGPSEGRGPEPFYPGEAALPSLRGAPPLRLPLLACGWRGIFARLLRRRRAPVP